MAQLLDHRPRHTPKDGASCPYNSHLEWPIPPCYFVKGDFKEGFSPVLSIPTLADSGQRYTRERGKRGERGKPSENDSSCTMQTKNKKNAVQTALDVRCNGRQPPHVRVWRLTVQRKWHKEPRVKSCKKRSQESNMMTAFLRPNYSCAGSMQHACNNNNNNNNNSLSMNPMSRSRLLNCLRISSTMTSVCRDKK